jgi:hypothetical protein
MKFKGVIPPGYELVEGRTGKYLRKKAEPRGVNRVLTKNNKELPEATGVASVVLRAVAPERRYFWDNRLADRFKSRLMKGLKGDLKWWTKDWLKDFELHAGYRLQWLVTFDASYAFSKEGCSVTLDRIHMDEWTPRKKKDFLDMNVKVVVVYVDEPRERYHRYESETVLLKRNAKSAVINVAYEKKPSLPYMIFLHGNGTSKGQPMELAEATGMKVVGSGYAEKLTPKKRLLK